MPMVLELVYKTSVVAARLVVVNYSNRKGWECFIKGIEENDSNC